MATKKEEPSVFATLYAVNVNDKTEKKNGLTYLSWPFAWGEVKKAYPEATYRIYENAEGWNYFTDGRTCWVKTSVTIEGIEHIEYLPVMDFRNNSIPADVVKSTDVNKAIQRSLTKCCARHGLGLYIYAGEDIPEGDKEQPQAPKAAPKQQPAQVGLPVTIDTLKARIAKATDEAQLLEVYNDTPGTMKATIKPLLTARKNELKGGGK